MFQREVIVSCELSVQSNMRLTKVATAVAAAAAAAAAAATAAAATAHASNHNIENTLDANNVQHFSSNVGCLFGKFFFLWYITLRYVTSS
jgi:hypothetical protein